MELGICLDDDFFEEESEKTKPKEKPYNVKLCEKEWIFKSPICNDKVEKQNITKFQADFWYRSGQYYKALKSYKFIQENPQVSSSTVEREIAESVVRCYIKLKQFNEAVHVIHSMLKNEGDVTSLMLMLAKICSAAGNIQGEIACLKRCISIHSYNHHFWYSLALAYSKAYKFKESTEDCNIAVVLAEALEKNKTNHKDSLKIYIKCSHCKCLDEIKSWEKFLPKVKDQCEKGENRNKKDKEERCFDSVNENTFLPLMDEIILFTNKLSISNETKREIIQGNGELQNVLSEPGLTTGNLVQSELSIDDSSECSKNALSATFSLKSDSGTKEPGEAHRNCSFSVKLKSSKYYQQQTDAPLDHMSLKDKQNVISFFCLVRARFHLQRAMWTSSSFIKDKLAIEIAKVNERIDKYVLCKCGELKKCCLKKIDAEDAGIISEKLGEK